MHNVSAEELTHQVLKALQNVHDPEISTVSIVDLGMLEAIEITSDIIRVKLVPTFLGCPALEIIRQNVASALKSISEEKTLEILFIYHVPWTSDRISEEGRVRLKEFGIAPPPRFLTETGSWEVDCPYCDSPYTTLENLFGPTACRSILYCRSCKNPFEAMKPMSINM